MKNPTVFRNSKLTSNVFLWINSNPLLSFVIFRDATGNSTTQITPLMATSPSSLNNTSPPPEIVKHFHSHLFMLSLFTAIFLCTGPVRLLWSDRSLWLASVQVGKERGEQRDSERVCLQGAFPLPLLSQAQWKQSGCLQQTGMFYKSPMNIVHKHSETAIVFQAVVSRGFSRMSCYWEPFQFVISTVCFSVALSPSCELITYKMTFCVDFFSESKFQKPNFSPTHTLFYLHGTLSRNRFVCVSKPSINSGVNFRRRKPSCCLRIFAKKSKH